MTEVAGQPGQVARHGPSRGLAETVHFRPRRWRPQRRGLMTSLNLAPMIDVTFLLLIFFVVSTTFKRAEGLFGTRLQQTVGRPAPMLPISPIIVRLTPLDGAGSGCRIRIDSFATEPATFGELALTLRQIQENPGFDQTTPVVLVADDDLEWDHVVGAWNAAVRASCTNIHFGR